jgi:dihydrofolate synthase/folylpolyglutamate synthase
MSQFPPPDPVAEALNAHFGPEFGGKFASAAQGSTPLDLSALKAALETLGAPHRHLPPVIHIAGTNGKGSTAAFTRAILEAAGLRVHAFTQPHLIHTRERITIAGHEIQEPQFLALIERVARCAPGLSHFEAQTACAFLAFAETTADAVILEVGCGGLLDATNVIASPAVSLITPIGFDHQAILGNTLSQIATHKAGILKPNAPAFSAAQAGEAEEAIRKSAEKALTTVGFQGQDWQAWLQPTGGLALQTEHDFLDLPRPGLQGQHQAENAGLAILGVRALQDPRINESAVAEGIAGAQWPGRLQRLKTGPLALIAAGEQTALFADGGHNPPAATALTEWIAAQNRRTALICGMLADKDIAAFLAPLAPSLSAIVAVEPKGPRPAHNAQAVVKAAQTLGIAHTDQAADLAAATTKACRAVGAAGLVVITGSLSLAGEALNAA